MAATCWGLPVHCPTPPPRAAHPARLSHPRRPRQVEPPPKPEPKRIAVKTMPHSNGEAPKITQHQK